MRPMDLNRDLTPPSIETGNDFSAFKGRDFLTQPILPHGQTACSCLPRGLSTRKNAVATPHPSPLSCSLTDGTFYSETQHLPADFPFSSADVVPSDPLPVGGGKDCAPNSPDTSKHVPSQSAKGAAGPVDAPAQHFGKALSGDASVSKTEEQGSIPCADAKLIEARARRLALQREYARLSRIGSRKRKAELWPRLQAATMQVMGLEARYA